VRPAGKKAPPPVLDEAAVRRILDRSVRHPARQDELVICELDEPPVPLVELPARIGPRGEA